ncbi:PREDICTED: FK506-binding protein 59 [Ceratosolen solmsi marchali]|uniref:peptidylprolyl isomerase n=1 Tax=Ceratosolen solmsi marchali TaxID=326594 RepID=A0AAJ6YCR7_9HYME|nr:PREDICTED: FK506-binding protein 59 [Ceratosolen solmsi marchali]XP_011495236.1 PREDICTED: FK506-binding protein 59 [Ceratosolen solmsi marchali]
MAVDISPKNSGGVLKEILKEGSGDESPGIGSFVKLHYVGTLLDGKKFDSSRDNGKPFEFELGLGQVINGFDIGIATMKKGEIAVFTIAPDFAYGEPGSPPNIPPNSTLKFEIELLDWTGEDLSPDKDKGITRKLIKAGQGHSSPNDGGVVDINIVGLYDDQVFEERDVKFELGEGEAEGIVEGIEIALLKFKKGEKSKVKLSSKYAFGAAGNSELNIPPNANVEYIIELKNFEMSVSSWNLDGAQKIEQAKMFKDKGTSYFKNNKYNLAIKMYKKIIEFTNPTYDYKEDLMETRDNLLLTANLNLALCFLKTQQYLDAKECCNKALELDPKNEKAFFRRGQVHLDLASPELAVKDFKEVIKIEPKNSAAAKQIIICNNLIKKELSKEKKLYANMFEKFAKEDQQKLEEELSKLPDVMHGTLGEWGQEERPGGRDATAFEKENPNILMLNANGTGEFKNM